MSKIAVSLKIDVTKIDKARLFAGKKGTYLDATIFIDLDEADQYGNHGMITQNVTKAEKDAGERGAILGNGKIFWRDGDQGQSQARPAAQADDRQGFDDFDDPLPF